MHERHAYRDFEYDVSSYTFGSPRCGNARFASEYNRIVPRTFRMINTLDIVPQLPPFLVYKHVDCECRLFTDPGQVSLLKRNDVSLFGGPGVSRTVRPPHPCLCTSYSRVWCPTLHPTAA